MHNFKELKIWQMSRGFVKDIYNVTRNLPHEELFILTSQMRRAAISIPSNISEGAGRNSDKEFVRFIDIALGSSFELETQLFLCFDQNYLAEIELNSVLDNVQKIQKMLYNFKSSLTN
jgi:four helix bundle protein